MFAKSTLRSFAPSPARITLALLLTVLLVFPDLALAQTACNSGQWEQTSVSLQNPIETFASTVATVSTTSYLYVVGGFDCNVSGVYNCGSGTAQTQVGHAKLNSDGSLGAFAWQNLWSIPGESQPVGLSRDLCGVIYTSPATGKNFIYTVGGLVHDPVTNTSALTNQIWYAQIAVTPNNGNVLAWHEALKADGVTPFTLPSAPDLEGVAVLNGYLYVIGGSTNNSNPAAGLTDQVWSAQLNPNTGNLMGSGFTSQPPILPATGGVYKTCPVVDAATNTIYLAGGETNNGLNNNASTANVSYAVQGTGGVLTDGNGHSQWASATQINKAGTASPLASQAVVFNSGITGIILMGGDQGKGVGDTGSVVQGLISTPASINWSWTALPSLPSAVNIIERNAGATNGSFIYSLGGEEVHGGVSIDTNAIYCLAL